MYISDDALTNTRIEPIGQARRFPKEDRVLLIACGALAREILTLIKDHKWDHMDVTCLPAKLHNYPKQIPDKVERIIQDNQNIYRTIFVVYADCGTGGILQKRCADLGVSLLRGPHCYASFVGLDRFIKDAETNFTSFYLTDFLVRQFDSIIWKPLGLDRHPELHSMYFGHYEHMVYLAQTENPILEDQAKQCAQRLGLNYIYQFTGYGDLGISLHMIATLTGQKARDIQV